MYERQIDLHTFAIGGVDNTAGQYAWAVDCSLGDQATYGLKITWDGDSTGATFQYSNPFQITKSTSGAAATTTTSAAAVATYAAANNDVSESTLYSTDYVTITSCAATVTDCPARSTVVSSVVTPVLSSGGAAPPPTTLSATTSVAATTPAPVYPVGNTTTTGSGYNIGTVTLPKTSTTGSGSSPSSTPVTAGAGRVAAGSFALVAGAVVALFAL